MHVLILGARSPACLEWARVFAATGWRVSIADSLAWPITRFSNSISTYTRLPGPKSNLKEWINHIVHLVQHDSIDLIIPTCEEAFYLAFARERIARYCRVLVSDLELMQRLHHKGTFAEMARDWPIQAPDTRLLETVESLHPFLTEPENWVFKPAYSRFATHTLVGPGQNKLARVVPSYSSPWIAQQRVNGQEYCSYSLLVDGQITAHCCYQPAYRAGNGAGIFFQPIESELIYTFVKVFGEQTKYTGQVGFDFMQNPDDQLNVLECNPRSTSGVHLLADQPQELVDALLGVRSKPLQASYHPRMVALAMLLFTAPSHLTQKDFRQHFLAASDVVACRHDHRPSVFQLISVAEIALRAIRLRTNLLSASTADIVWDGDPITENGVK